MKKISRLHTVLLMARTRRRRRSTKTVLALLKSERSTPNGRKYAKNARDTSDNACVRRLCREESLVLVEISETLAEDAVAVKFSKRSAAAPCATDWDCM